MCPQSRKTQRRENCCHKPYWLTSDQSRTCSTSPSSALLSKTEFPAMLSSRARAPTKRTTTEHSQLHRGASRICRTREGERRGDRSRGWLADSLSHTDCDVKIECERHFNFTLNFDSDHWLDINKKAGRVKLIELKLGDLQLGPCANHLVLFLLSQTTCLSCKHSNSMLVHFFNC